MTAPATLSTKLGALLAKDAQGIVRDRLMLFLVGYGMFIAAVLRFVVPLAPIEGLDAFVAPAVPMIGSLLVGSVLGFALVEEREARTWLLLRVLPISERSLSVYLYALATLGGLVAGAACAAVYGQPVERPGLFVAALASASLGAPLIAFFIGSMASNKIEAMAMGKLANIPVAAAVLAFVIPAPWHVLLWWSPFYWIYLVLLRSMASDALLADAPLVIPVLPDPAFVLIPAALLVLTTLPLIRRFRTVAS